MVTKSDISFILIQTFGFTFMINFIIDFILIVFCLLGRFHYLSQWRTPLSEPLEPFEGVVDENPILVGLPVSRLTFFYVGGGGDFEIYVGEIVEI